MKKLSGWATIPALLLSATLSMFLSPAMAMNYAPPGPYELSVGGSYTGQDNQESISAGCSTNGPTIGTCPYIPADFSQGASSGNPTIYDFTMSISTGTAYFNIGGPTNGDTKEEVTISIYSCTSLGSGTSCNGETPVAGPKNLLNIPVPNGDSLALSAGDYLIILTQVTDNDPTMDISLTSAAEGAVVSATTPLPASLPMLASGLGFLGVLARRRKRNAVAVATA